MSIDFDFYNAITITMFTVEIIGIVGNIITFIVFSRPAFRKNTISIYCRSLAIFDSFIIDSVVINFLLIFYNYYIAVYSDEACKLVSYITYAFGSIPGWILIAFSVDKLLGLKRITNRMKRPIVHYMILLGIVLFNLLLYIEIPIYLVRVPTDYYGSTIMFCDTSFLSFGSILNLIYLIEASILPFAILFVSSLITIKLLRDSRRQVNSIGLVVDKKRKSREKKFAITSLVFNVLFIVLKLPLLICLAIGYSLVDLNFLQVATFLFYLYFSLGFFVHFGINSLFRREFLILLRIPGVDSSLQKQNKNHHLSKPNTKYQSQINSRNIDVYIE